tara:strand:- start:57 stop:383 length:327 start_codon:yes stop_codon:yes gene_type:complete
MTTNKSLEVKLDKLTDVVTSLVTVISPQEEPKVEPTAVASDVEYSDPTVQALFETEAKLIRKLGEGGNNRLVRGKRGINIINETVDNLEHIRDLMKERKLYRRNFMKG